MSDITVVRAGPLTTVQDRGRPGWAHIGVAPSGAMDRDALAFGNRIVGNDPAAAALEATLVGPSLRFRVPALVALTGAESNATVSGHPAAANALVRVAPGEVLELRGLVAGVRAYICVRGGIDAEPALGSRSTDLMGGLGPPPLRDGDALRIGAEPRTPPDPQAEAPTSPPGVPVLRVVAGPREDWFAPGALEALCASTWRVDPASNRIGLRLRGPKLERVNHGELLSEGLVTGAIQVPPSGQPIVLLNDHPTTGGYPVLAAVQSDDVALTAQLGPHSALRFALSP